MLIIRSNLELILDKEPGPVAVWTLCLGRLNGRKNESAVHAANNPYFTALVDVVGYGLVIMEKESTAIQGIHAWVKFIPH